MFYSDFEIDVFHTELVISERVRIYRMNKY